MLNIHGSKITARVLNYLRKSIEKTRKDRIRDVQIRKDLQKEVVTNDIERKGLIGFGHVARMSEDRKPKQIEQREKEETEDL